MIRFSGRAATVRYNYVKMFDTRGIEIFHVTIADSVNTGREYCTPGRPAVTQLTGCCCDNGSPTIYYRRCYLDS